MSSASLIRKTGLMINKDTCGGNKKPGLPPRVGASLTALLDSNRQHPKGYNPGDPPFPCPASWRATRNHGNQRKTMIY